MRSLFLACAGSLAIAACSGGGSSLPSAVSGGLTNGSLASQNSQPAARMAFLDFLRMRASAPPISTRSAAAFSVGGTFVDAARNSALLYVSNAPTNSYDVPGTVNIYSQVGHSQQMVGQIRDLYSPASLAVDESNNLYVVQVDNGAPVLVFAPGATKPFLRLQVPASLPTAVGIGPNDVFVAVSAYFGPITCQGQTGAYDICIFAYKKGASTSYKSFGTNGDAISGIMADRNGDIYYVWNEATDTALYELEAGTDTPIYLGLNRILNPLEENGGGAFPGMFLDQKGDLVLLQSVVLNQAGTIRIRNGQVSIYPPGASPPRTTLHLAGGYGIAAPNAMFSKFFVASQSSNDSIEEYTYPQGVLVDTIMGNPNNSTFGVATKPAPPLSPPF